LPKPQRDTEPEKSLTSQVLDRRLHQSLGDVEANQLTWDIHQLMSIDPTLFMSPSQKDRANFIRVSPMSAMTEEEEKTVKPLQLIRLLP
jgi:hypothetical protein